ncbi:hypothetical protein DRJ00_08265 [Candidatus Aerophobetes bacterium]|uniref:Uncharacterized protein n=1 Tax=Aerophobetes bacterium TaxID=2030807 RepID=A0A497E4J8_UNCAE|nr:MAG: hypothetical protein DRJ00_08265 [Candidatus Aerophobetes bacterium]
MTTTGIVLTIAIIAVIFIIIIVPIYPITESFPVEKKREVPLKYEVRESYITPVGILDWELEHVTVVENVDEKGGTFTVSSKVYDGDRLVYHASDRKYIGVGQKVKFVFKTEGLSYSTDWRDRYSVHQEVVPPTKIESFVATNHKTEYVNLIAYIQHKKGEISYLWGQKGR